MEEFLLNEELNSFTTEHTVEFQVLCVFFSRANVQNCKTYLNSCHVWHMSISWHFGSQRIFQNDSRRLSFLSLNIHCFVFHHSLFHLCNKNWSSIKVTSSSMPSRNFLFVCLFQPCYFYVCSYACALPATLFLLFDFVHHLCRTLSWTNEGVTDVGVHCVMEPVIYFPISAGLASGQAHHKYW